MAQRSSFTRAELNALSQGYEDMDDLAVTEVSDMALEQGHRDRERLAKQRRFNATPPRPLSVLDILQM